MYFSEEREKQVLLRATFAARLKRIRGEMQLTQIQLSYKTGINEVVLKQYESQTTLPGAQELVSLAKTLKVSVDVLLGLQPYNLFP